MANLIERLWHLASGAWVLGLAALPVLLIVAGLKTPEPGRFHSARILTIMTATGLVVLMASSFGGAFLGSLGDISLSCALVFAGVGLIGAAGGYVVLRQIPAFRGAPAAYMAMRAAMAGASLTFAFLWATYVIFLATSVGDNPRSAPGAVLTALTCVVPLLGGLAVVALGFWAAFRAPAGRRS